MIVREPKLKRGNLRTDRHVFRDGAGFRNGQPVGLETFQMELDGFVHDFFRLGGGLAGRHAAWQVGRVGRVVAAGFFDDDEEAVHDYFFRGSFSCACLSTLISVSSARYSWRASCRNLLKEPAIRRRAGLRPAPTTFARNRAYRVI